jgi:glycosyltransferase involved in cell wall biosynthesis
LPNDRVPTVSGTLDASLSRRHDPGAAIQGIGKAVFTLCVPAFEYKANAPLSHIGQTLLSRAMAPGEMGVKVSIEPVISIITVVLNDAEGLQRTANSLTSYKPAGVEWIIVDGLSTDGTLDVITACGNAVDATVSERDTGVYDAMHKGVKLATGRLVYFLNAGDELLPGALEAILSAAREAPEDAVLCGEWYGIEENGAVWLGRPHPAALARYMSISHQASLVPRTVFDDGEGFDLAYTLSADYDLFLRLHLAGRPFVVIPEPLVRYYRGGLSDRRLVRSRLEGIRALWVRRSPHRLAGTRHYLLAILRHYLKPFWRRLKGREAGGIMPGKT